MHTVMHAATVRGTCCQQLTRVQQLLQLINRARSCSASDVIYCAQRCVRMQLQYVRREMDVSDLRDLLSGILQRLRLIELKIDVIREGRATMELLAEIRRDRLEDYKRTYYWQNAVTEPCPCQEEVVCNDELD
jgi:hypothetical protein